MIEQKIINLRKKSIELYGNFYFIPGQMYVNNKTKISIICPIHGEFKSRPNDHSNGYGCKKCGIEKRSLKCRKTLQEFINEASKVHGFYYDYSLVVYINNKTKISIICPLHGVFLQQPDNHLNGHDCNNCSYEDKRSSLSEFIEGANKIHNFYYNYSNVVYNGDKIKVGIICPKHGKFMQSPRSHLSGRGCSKCPTWNNSKPEQKWLDGLGIIRRQVRMRINNKLYIVDGFDEKINTIFEFLGDFWHGNPSAFPPDYKNPINKKTMKQLLVETKERIKTFEDNGFKVVYIWEKDYRSLDST